MATIYDIDGNSLIEKAAVELKKLKEIKMPEWASFIKTGPAKDRVPTREDWWYVRSAAILRSIYRSQGPIGVQKLRIKYGSKKNRGHKPEKFYKASGKIVRLIMQQLEKEELIKNAKVDVHKGRVISAKGKSFLDSLATSMVPKKAPVPKKVEKKDEEKESFKEILADLKEGETSEKSVKAKEKPMKTTKEKPYTEGEKPKEKQNTVKPAKPTEEEKPRDKKPSSETAKQKPAKHTEEDKEKPAKPTEEEKPKDKEPSMEKKEPQDSAQPDTNG